MVEEERLKLETVGCRYKKQLLQWSGCGATKSIVLLYKANRDGFTSKAFHSHCDKKGETWTVLQDVNGNVFGGYASVSWQGEVGWVADPAAYIFRLVNPQNIPPTKFEQTDQLSIWDRKANFPSFGGGHDIFLEINSNLSYANFPISYVDTTGKGRGTFTGHECFKTKELEVWGSISTLKYCNINRFEC